MSNRRFLCPTIEQDLYLRRRTNPNNQHISLQLRLRDVQKKGYETSDDDSQALVNDNIIDEDNPYGELEIETDSFKSCFQEIMIQSVINL